MAPTPSEIEQWAQALAQRAGEIWASINEKARDHYRKLARKQLAALTSDDTSLE